MPNNKKLTKQRIEDLTKQLAGITQELQQLQIQVQREWGETRRQSRLQQRRRSMQIGDLVQITNNYQNLQGTQGRVIRLSTIFVTLQKVGRTQNSKRNTKHKTHHQRINSIRWVKMTNRGVINPTEITQNNHKKKIIKED